MAYRQVRIYVLSALLTIAWLVAILGGSAVHAQAPVAYPRTSPGAQPTNP